MKAEEGEKKKKREKEKKEKEDPTLAAVEFSFSPPGRHQILNCVCDPLDQFWILVCIVN